MTGLTEKSELVKLLVEHDEQLDTAEQTMDGSPEKGQGQRAMTGLEGIQDGATRLEMMKLEMEMMKMKMAHEREAAREAREAEERKREVEERKMAREREAA